MFARQTTSERFSRPPEKSTMAKQRAQFAVSGAAYGAAERLLIVALLALVWMGAVFGRLAYVQLVRHGDYLARALRPPECDRWRSALFWELPAAWWERTEVSKRARGSFVFSRFRIS